MASVGYENAAVELEQVFYLEVLFERTEFRTQVGNIPVSVQDLIR